MKILLGKNRHTRENIFWDSESVVNRHFIVVGESGSGKTHTLRGLTNGLAQNNIRCYVFDVHSDIHTNPALTSTIKFGINGRYGLQPLAIDPDPEFGGVRRTINTFVDAFMAANRSSGEIQQHALDYSLVEMYKSFGFIQEDPRTWNLYYGTSENGEVKRQPTLKDLIEFVKKLVIQLSFGMDGEGMAIMSTLDALVKKLRNLERSGAKAEESGDYETIEKIEKRIEETKEKLQLHFQSNIEEIASRDNIERFIRIPQLKTLESILRRLENLYNSGIFREKEFNFDLSKPIQRFDMRSLDTTTKVVFVQLMLKKIFEEEKARGESKDMRCAIILDEAKGYITQKENNYVETISTEGRKFGISQILAGQNLEQFNNEIISNCATKIVLGVDSTYHDSTKKKLGINKDIISNIIHMKRILVQIKSKKENANDFMEVEI